MSNLRDGQRARGCKGEYGSMRRPHRRVACFARRDGSSRCGAAAFCAPLAVPLAWPLDALWEREKAVPETCASTPRMVVRRLSEAARRALRAALRRQDRKRRERATREEEKEAAANEWAQLVIEFERRTNNRFSSPPSSSSSSLTPSTIPLSAKGDTSAEDNDELETTLQTLEAQHEQAQIPRFSPRQPYLNPAQFEMLPYVESAFMAALAYSLWFLGRLLRLDALLLLFYPLPNMYIAARWGLEHSDRTLGALLLVLFTHMGPFYAKLYLFNSGMLTYTYTRALWYGWSWPIALLAGAFAKAVGLVVSLFWLSLILKHNPWAILTEQVQMLLGGLCSLLRRLPLLGFIGAPSALQVQIGIVVIIAIHSLYHVFCTLFVSTLFLVKVAEKAPLARVPKDMPFILKLLRRTKGL